MRSSARILAACAVLSSTLASASPPPAGLDCFRGIEAYREGKLDEAARILGRVVAAEPAATSAGHYLGLALIRLGRTADGRRALEVAARSAPDDGALQLDLGLVYLGENKHAFAMRSLQHSVRLLPNDGRARYYLGLALVRMGDAENALEVLEQARKLGGADPQALQLQLGIASYMAQQWERSRVHLDGLTGGLHGGVARRMLRASFDAEGRPASFVSAQVSTAFVVDTNSLYEHETTAPTALGPAVAAGVMLRPWVAARHWLEGGLSAARTFYFPTTEQEPGSNVSDASRTDVSASASYAYRVPLDDGSLQMSFGYGFGLTFLDGDPPMADESHIFVERHGALVGLAWNDGSATTLLLRYGLTREVYADLPRNNWGNEAAVEVAHALLGGQMRLLGWGSFRHESAQSTDYDAIRPGVGLGLSYLLPLDLVLGVQGGYEYADHVASEGGRWGSQRLDHVVSFTAELGRALPYGLRIRAVYQRLQNISTVESYDYSRDVFDLRLSWSTP